MRDFEWEPPAHPDLPGQVLDAVSKLDLGRQRCYLSRADVDPARETRVFRPSRAAQAESYLLSAIEALRNAGDPRYLWSPAPRRWEGSFLAPHQRATDAANRRLRTLRGSVVMAALSVEAYANDFLLSALSPADARALDRLPTLDKLIAGPKTAGMDPPLERGREPAQTIQRLFVARNALVHPRRGGPGAFAQYLTEPDEETFGPHAAGGFIAGVAQTTTAMEQCLPAPSLAGTAALLTRHPEVVSTLVAQVGAAIGALVPEDAIPPCDPVEAAERLAMQLGGGNAPSS